MKITVKVYEAGNLVVEKALDEGVYRGGRSEFADINLPSDAISRSHFELRVTESNVYLTNMSVGGRIKINGKQVETSEVKDGDVVHIGPYELAVGFGESLGEPAVAAGSAKAGSADAPSDDAGGEAPAGADAYGGFDNAGLPEPEPSRGSRLDSIKGGGEGSSFPFGSPARQETEGTAALNRAETVVESKHVVAKLMFIEGPRKGDELFVEAYEISMGRSKKADIFLDDEKLSRIHAKITRVGMGFRLIDQQSRNGTYVNGMRILEHPLSSFDTIEIGNTKIKFLIHDMVGGDIGKMGRSDLIPSPGNKLGAVEQTKSIQLSDEDRRVFLDLQSPTPPSLPPHLGDGRPEAPRARQRSKRTLFLGLALLGLLAAYYVISSGPEGVKPTTQTATEPKGPDKVSPPLPSVLSKEYLDLSPELQRAVEGYYNTALRAADREMYQEALENLQKIHDNISYYKESASLREMYQRRLKEKQAQLANEKAKKDDKQELQILIEDGVKYLKEGEWDKAAEAFNYAIQIDLENPIVKKGLKAADLKIRDLDKVPEDRNPLKEKETEIRELFRKALTALDEGRYQEAITMGEDIRKIELPGRTDYLNEAKQIIDKGRVKQKEQFEPFLIDAKGKYAEGDFNASRELCDEMLKKDPSFVEAGECVLKAKNQLNKLAKEAYTLGLILESMNRIEEAKQYWNRAKNYVRPGDPYFEKVMKKLEYYQ